MGVVPVGETIFSTQTIVIVLALAVVVPIMMILMRPSDDERVDLPDSVLAESQEMAGIAETERATLKVSPGPGAAAASELEKSVPAERLERSRAIPLALGLLGLLYLVSYYAGGGVLNINMVIYSFLVAGLLLVPNTRDYLTQLGGGARCAAGIIVQFPFYGALMGVMVGTGLATSLANFFVGISSAETLPFWGFIGGGIVNMFVPSGGGQWAVQGPLMMEAAQQLGADPAKVAMGVAWGDAWTNMIQPFWALPLLAIAGLGIRSIMGYTAVLVFVSGAIIGLGLLFL
jgi:short-chain fatty acids transporter